MAKLGRGLGKGLEALLGDYSSGEGDPLLIDIHLLDPNKNQPRKQFDEEKLSELASSIKAHGVIQPLLVCKNDGRFTIIAGERRYRAARIAGIKQVPVIVREYDERQLLEVSLIENIQRSDLNPVEEAAAIKFLMQQHDLTQEEVSTQLGKSRPAIANSLRLLNLDENVLEMLRTGVISAGHARVLVSMPLSEQRQLAMQIAKQGLSVRELENIAKSKRTKQKPAKFKKQRVVLSPELTEATNNLREVLKTKVNIQGDEESGRIVIDYYSNQDLIRLYEFLTQQ